MINLSVVEINFSVENNIMSVYDGNFLYCVEEESFILIMVVVIWVLGVIGNIVIFFKIIFNKWLWCFVFVFVVCLIVVDFCSLCM